MKPIYIPKGAAKEYGDYALNIYTGCPHRCYYCFAPSVLRRDREVFHNHVEPRDGIVDATRKQLEAESSATREIIKLLKAAGNHVQILTKNGADAMRDFDLLDGEDWFGVTHTGYNENPTISPPIEPNAGTLFDRIKALVIAKNKGIRTWVSCEPTIDPIGVLKLIETGAYIDLFKIGKLNYHPSNVDWAHFGRVAEERCKEYGRNYYIKDSLRREMEK